jgi:hypothetical protein
LFVCGDNHCGQLGLGDNYNRNSYVKLKHNFGKIKNISCGENHNIILNENNELYVCGDNIYGQLGLGDRTNRNTYIKIKHNFGKIKNIYCGGDHNIILNNKNELFVCGDNYVGQLGLGDNINRNIYEKLEHNFGQIKNIYCGGFHTIILNTNDELFVCGRNTYGQLGLGDNINRKIYEKLEHNFGKIKDIKCGARHSIILNMKNELFVCGDNIYGQLGLGDNITGRNIFEKLHQNMLEYNIRCNNFISINTNDIIEL